MPPGRPGRDTVRPPRRKVETMMGPIRMIRHREARLRSGAREYEAPPASTAVHSRRNMPVHSPRIPVKRPRAEKPPHDERCVGSSLEDRCGPGRRAGRMAQHALRGVEGAARPPAGSDIRPAPVRPDGPCSRAWISPPPRTPRSTPSTRRSPAWQVPGRSGSRSQSESPVPGWTTSTTLPVWPRGSLPLQCGPHDAARHVEALYIEHFE